MKIRKYGLMLSIGLIMMSGCANNMNLDRQSKNVQNEYFAPTGDRLTPAGKLIKYGTADIEQHAMDCRLSPDGKILAVEGRFYLTLIDTKTDKVINEINLKKSFLSKKHSGNMYSGIAFSKDGKHIYWTTSLGDILEAALTGTNAAISKFYHFDKENGRPALPNDIKFSKDGKYMYVTLNGADKVAKIDVATKELVWEKGTKGNFPYGLAIANKKIFVTNWGGKLANPYNDIVSKGGWNNEKAGFIKVDSMSESAASGTVSVMDENGNVIKTLNVGLHPNDIISNEEGSKVYVANANSDTVSVIDTKTYKIENIGVSPNRVPYGFSPDALALSPDEKFLFVADGNLNCVSVIDLSNNQVIGLIPTGAYPGGLDVSKDGEKLYVADTEGLYSRATTQNKNDKHFKLNYPQKGRKNISTAGYYNTHREFAYISDIKLPELEKEDLQYWTNQVKTNMQYRKLKKAIEESMLPPRKNVKPVPVPERLGEPSVFKHVIYIIKENRTYDQVLGDMKEGNGEAYLTVFGKKVTPNMHKLAREFGLLDNFYDVGKCSAEGHPWSDSAFVDDYVEKNVRGWFRGYPHVILDAMVSPKTGYIWDDVLFHGHTFKNYGENVQADVPKYSTWKQFYTDYKNGISIPFKNYVSLNNIAKYTSNTYPGYDHHRIPDEIRADAFIKDIKKATDSNFPDFTIMALPADHTSHLKPGYPTPASMVADNDLALGRIVEAVSHSPIWKDTVIFVLEDDTQDGWDHVSSYRGPAWVISPYSKKHQVIHTFYTQLSVLHTIERILGIPPMNINDATAPVMYSCFTNKPDFTPYTHVKNQIPLDNMNPKPDELSGLARKWSQIASKLDTKMDNSANDDLLNKMIWYSAKGYNTPYPSKYVIKSSHIDDDD
ncbi:MULTISPECIES: bifunctional YncE family protein/alkaline phosphatase family protein [unclassified Lebetimonas]|uniref:bifunctional YncE family protein/alkaline phosphatase family protein n=1 Tax=unclassified Lebetimonas TaxID=2648158 RepID=UPI0004678808|nr:MULTISPECIES: bifunctional YncE family protein/alkaline phosphatase family protein [unclassified Lebetimonas]